MSKVKKDIMGTYVFAFPKAYFSQVEAFEILERRNWYELWSLSHHTADVVGVNKKIYYLHMNTFNSQLNSEEFDVHSYWIFVKTIRKAILSSQARASNCMARDLGVSLPHFATTSQVADLYRLKLKRQTNV